VVHNNQMEIARQRDANFRAIDERQMLLAQEETQRHEVEREMAEIKTKLEQASRRVETYSEPFVITAKPKARHSSGEADERPVATETKKAAKEVKVPDDPLGFIDNL
jgi:hypothetical protein